jgi:uncharacterized protein (DUF885 family)
VLLISVAGTVRGDTRSGALIADYIDAWRSFYPTRAFAYGDVSRAADFEEFSDARLGAWLALNASTAAQAGELLAATGNSPPGDPATDLRVLLKQAEREQALWRESRPRETQPEWYGERLSQALTHLLVREQLPPKERLAALVGRLAGVVRLCALGEARLETGTVMGIERALRTVSSTRVFYESKLGTLAAGWSGQQNAVSEAISSAIDDAVAALTSFEAFLSARLLPTAEARTSMGATLYAARLARRSAGAYTPAELLEEAGAEMATTRRLMVIEAKRWHDATAPDAPQRDEAAVLAEALVAMEAERDGTQEDFRETFRRLTYAAERFVESAGIATVPKPTTLFIDLSPAHFSGAAVGGVYPSGPFDPRAETLFYLPSIPDSAPAQARDGFYRSFNTHFNTMIISHEMFPGHYLQYKVAVSEAPALRSLFPDGAYVEGWGSFVEELMLDAGWADNAPLTRLAHLRKRLENATRAYVSVQVHTAGWDEERVLAFARDEGLLAPQFARNLWQRAVHSPLQITDYMRGYRQFRALWSARPENMATRDWVDAVLRAGPIPIAYLPAEAGL